MGVLVTPLLFFSVQIGKLIQNITLVVDMENVGVQILYRPFLDIYSEMLKIFEANYPETLHACFVINGTYWSDDYFKCLFLFFLLSCLFVFFVLEGYLLVYGEYECF